MIFLVYHSMVSTYIPASEIILSKKLPAGRNPLSAVRVLTGGKRCGKIKREKELKEAVVYGKHLA